MKAKGFPFADVDIAVDRANRTVDLLGDGGLPIARLCYEEADILCDMLISGLGLLDSDEARSQPL